jgi:hypothetical protein
MFVVRLVDSKLRVQSVSLSTEWRMLILNEPH